MLGGTTTSGVLQVAKAAAGFGYFWLGGAVLGFAVLPVAALGAKDRWDRVRRCQRLLRTTLRHYHRAIGHLDIGDVDTAAYAAVVPDAPCVIVANHPTILDVTLFFAEHEDVCVVANARFFRAPFIGALLRYCGHIDAGDGESATVVTEAMQRLEAGFKVLVFPEGTRSPLVGMHQFKRVAFDLAVQAEVPLLPVFVRCDPPSLMKGMRWWRSIPADRRFNLRLIPLPVMDWRPWAGRSRLFRKEVQSLVRERVDAWHRGTMERKLICTRSREDS